MSAGDDEYIGRREALLEIAVQNVEQRGTAPPDSYHWDRELLDEIDALYDKTYRPSQAEERQRVKDEIRQSIRQFGYVMRTGLPRATIH